MYNQIQREKLSIQISTIENNANQNKELVALLQERNKAATQIIESQKQMINGLESDIKNSRYSEEELRRERSKLFARLEYLEAALEAKGDLDDALPIPDSIEELVEWCEKYLIKKLVLSGKARRAISDSQYENISLIYNALLLYANEYRDMKMRTVEDVSVKEQYYNRLAELGLDDLGSPISDNRRGERKNEYTMIYDGVKFDFEHHIGCGNSRDPRYCLRIYSCWDPEGNRAIIGSLPTHLGTRIS